MTTMYSKYGETARVYFDEKFVKAGEYGVNTGEGGSYRAVTLTSDATSPSDGDTVVIGDTTYTFKTALTTNPSTVAFEVLIGASAAAALDNLKSAINATTGAGTTYGTGTTIHPTVSATTNTNTTQVVQMKTTGESSLPTLSETSSHLSWGTWSPPPTPSTGQVVVVLEDLAASYTFTSGSTYAVPVVGTMFPPGVPLQYRAHRTGGSESWTDLTVPGDGKTLDFTVSVSANTGWAIYFRVKESQVAVGNTTTFTVVNGT